MCPVSLGVLLSTIVMCVEHLGYFMTFSVLTIAVLRDVILCKWVDRYGRFGEAFWFYLKVIGTITIQIGVTSQKSVN